MNRLNHLKKATAVCFVALGFTWLVPSSTVKAVNPPPDGGYPSQNTAEGEEALFNLKTRVADNTAVGWHALFSTTTGHDNTAIGFISLQKNTTGEHNTAIGSSSLDQNTTGSFNVALGAGAGSNVITADD